MKLTDEQRGELKPIEDDFANTCQQYQKPTNPGLTPPRRRFGRRAQRRTTAQIKAARQQLQQVWAGLRPYRVTAVNQIKPLLTPDQLADFRRSAKTNGGENHGQEAQ